MAPESSESPTPTIDPTSASAAFAALQSTLQTLPSASVYRGTLNLTRAAMQALAAVPHLRANSARIASELPSVPADLADALEAVALAAFHADLLLDGTEESLLADIAPAATKLRKGLVAVMAGLIERERVPANLLDDITPGTGYTDLAEDLGKLADRFRSRWGALQGRVDVQPAELDTADLHARTILTRLANRRAPVASPESDAIADQRARVATLLRQTHDQARKVGTWLFWNDPEGIDARVPALGAGNARRKATAPIPPSEKP